MYVSAYSVVTNGQKKLTQIKAAIEFAKEKHLNHFRKNADKTPYIFHPLNMVDMLMKIKAPHDAICAAVLHDTIEDTDTTESELRVAFGHSITDIVLELSDDKLLSKAIRKRIQVIYACHKSENACYVSMVDKIDNCYSVLYDPPTDWDETRRLEYFIWAKQCIDGYTFKHHELNKMFYELYNIAIKRFHK